MRTLSSRRSAIATCVAALLCATTGSAFADTYPSKAIDFVVPYPPGGASDIIARLIAERLQACSQSSRADGPERTSATHLDRSVVPSGAMTLVRAL